MQELHETVYKDLHTRALASVLRQHREALSPGSSDFFRSLPDENSVLPARRATLSAPALRGSLDLHQRALSSVLAQHREELLEDQQHSHSFTFKLRLEMLARKKKTLSTTIKKHAAGISKRLCLGDVPNLKPS